MIVLRLVLFVLVESDKDSLHTYTASVGGRSLRIAYILGPLTESGKKGHQKPNEIDNSDFDMRVFNWGADRYAVGNENALKMANHTANIANEN